MTTKVNGLQLKIARLKAGLLQYQLAARLNIDPSLLSQYESGRKQPSPGLLKRIYEEIEAGSTGKG